MTAGRFRAFFLAALLLLPTGCGYHFGPPPAAFDERLQTVYVSFLANRTSEPFLEQYVTEAVLGEFARGTMLRTVESPEAADTLLEGAVIRYHNDAVAYFADDAIAEYRSTIILEATLREAASGDTLWKGTVSWSEEYRTSADKSLQEEDETVAIRAVSDRLAEELHARISQRF